MHKITVDMAYDEGLISYAYRLMVVPASKDAVPNEFAHAIGLRTDMQWKLMQISVGSGLTVVVSRLQSSSGNDQIK